jgi:hypothetical protein
VAFGCGVFPQYACEENVLEHALKIAKIPIRVMRYWRHWDGPIVHSNSSAKYDEYSELCYGSATYNGNREVYLVYSSYGANYGASAQYDEYPFDWEALGHATEEVAEKGINTL